MTALATSTPEEMAGAAPPGKHRARALGSVGSFVAEQIDGPRGIQARYLRDESSGRADVAALRRASSKAPGEIAEVWTLTQVKVPDFAGDEPTWEEVAVHTAMTLYAVHQQSRTTGMFRRGMGLGHAARDLIGPPDQENPSARSRFNALVTATTVAELCRHLRTFVSLLRAHEIPLDHAMLADDVVGFQRPGGARKVRLTWSRQYSRSHSAELASHEAASDGDHSTSTSSTTQSEN
ncbi:type I-E CRISPR-associated protein Cse2/CasB [Actinomyces slackii]|uniref:CRISPR-associated Cse2 family protein n=1 Tax=Actinomyces slackii TaxID=52774 RepID=A0A3S4TCJ5_9ACTO|nr:type I-E CRISPR-associated protein Cse2/CasB [Actinomyces slackii]VEG74734.1 CRISPR-associated Cse2 family protein [Actinomyces slackii]